MTAKAWIILGAVAAAAAAGTLSAKPPAAPSAELNVGTVNLEECFDKDKYAFIKDINAELEAMRTQMATEVDGLAKKLNDLGEQIKGLDKKTALYQEKLQMYKELDALLEVKSKHYQAKLKAQKLAKWTEVYNEICRVVNLVGADGKYDVVYRKEEPVLDDDAPEVALQRINSRVILYASDAYNITAKVIERLNQEYAKKKGPPASPTPTPKNP